MARRFYRRLAKKLAKARELIERGEVELPPPKVKPEIVARVRVPEIAFPPAPYPYPYPCPYPYPIPVPAPARVEEAKPPPKEEVPAEKEIRVRYEAVPLEVPPELVTPVRMEIPKETLEKLKEVSEVTSLVSMRRKERSVTMAWTNIRWNDRTNSLIYYLHEPPLSKEEKEILKEASELLKQKLDIDFTKIRLEKAYGYIIAKLDEIISSLGYKLTERQKLKFQYYIYRDFIGLGRIEPLMHDPNIEDISCDGVGIPVFVYHRNPLYGQLQTNVVFETREELDSFVMKLAQKCGRSITIAEPLLDGALPDGSRVQATLGTDIAMRGSNFTIRKFTERPLTPIDIINFGTSTPEIFAYLWLAIENKCSVLVAGAAATGKTSLLNAFSLFIRPEAKIISIEDTPELRLPHPNWIPSIARAGFGPKGYGEITMFDLLKAAFRQRPEYVIVGEVRGAEAYVMFQGMATGHPAFGTIHADSVPAVIDRLTTKPIDLPRAILQHLDIIVFLVLTRLRGEYVRRISEIVEIIGYDFRRKEIVTNRAFRWNPAEDKYVLLKSVILDKIRERMGVSIDELRDDMRRRAKLLEWLRDKGITDYREVARFFSLYYTDPKYIEDLIKGG
jgi:flagellar protein FlaI